MNTIISKRTTPFVYTKYYTDSDRGICKPIYSILVNGGAGVVGGAEILSGKSMNERSIFTPEGVATIVDDDTLAKLMDVPKFQKDIKRGLILVLKKKSVTSQDKIDELSKKELLEGDHIKTRPITMEDLENAGARKVSDDDDEDGGLAVNITKMKVSPTGKRNAEAGLPSYEKKRRSKRQTSDGVFIASVSK
jgi:hypothetical protein